MSHPGDHESFECRANIELNPGQYYGTWTPEGWRTHRIQSALRRSATQLIDGDGRATRFQVLPDEFLETVHDGNDPLTDGGIYPSDPKVEYPPGDQRWALSHSFLAYPVADQTLYQQEYIWEKPAGVLETHFRQHVVLEEARTDANDGLSLNVAHGPISTVIAGNKLYPLCNSAVRGVWDNPEKTGKNYYARDVTRLCASHNAVYILVDDAPVVQCMGIWKAEPGDLAAFDTAGLVVDARMLIERGIPLDCPKLGAVGYSLKRVASEFYGKEVEVMDGESVPITPQMLESLRACRDVSFRAGGVGFAAWGSWDHAAHISGVPGHYACHWDLNDDGVVGSDDEDLLAQNLGRRVRPNYYSAAYFGNDWLSAGVLLNPEMISEPVICHWRQGAGYDAERGVVRLLESPGANRPVFVEYHYDAPAEAGCGNVRMHISRKM